MTTTTAKESNVETKVITKKNGIKRPDEGSVTGTLWDIADRQSAALNAPAPRAAVVKEYMEVLPGANQSTANTQYARWVQYHDASDALKAARAQAKIGRAHV